MKKVGRSSKNFFDGYNHYDKRGKKIGTSSKNFFGGYTNYDEHGKKVGTSRENFWGGYTHYDKHGNKIGKSYGSFLGGYNHYDKKGKKIRESNDSFLGNGYNNYASEGCYIATAVYGSYNCKEVWVLRRYRDYVLYENVLGRIFIKMYYKLSPSLVRVCGKKKWFQKIGKKLLDRKVEKLKEKGYEDLPYQDKMYTK